MYPYSRYQRDIYRCVSCNNWVGKGDVFCKHCGYKYTSEDTDNMIKDSTLLKRWNAPTVGRFDENLRCNYCNTHIAIGDLFCKNCGHQFTDSDIDAIRGPVSQKLNNIVIFAIFFFVLILVFIVTL